MSEERPLKSAYELAMERLARRDVETGASLRPLTADQKAAIAEVRVVYQAKMAEQEVLHASRLRRTADPVEREKLETWRYWLSGDEDEADARSGE